MKSLEFNGFAEACFEKLKKLQEKFKIKMTH